MLAGFHHYDFECTLPVQIPGSFEAKHGSITYKILVKADIPWAIDKEIKRTITVVRVEDLNLHMNAFFPVKSELTRSFCSLTSCSVDSCILTLTTHQSGYVPCQVLPFHLKFYNKSEIKICYTRVTLRRVIIYLSDSPSIKGKVKSENMAQIHFDKLPEIDHVTSCKGELKIPPNLHPSNEHCCRVVKVSYELLIEAVPEGCRSNIKLKTPIIIGTMPIRNAQSTEELHAHNSHQPGQYNGEILFIIN